MPAGQPTKYNKPLSDYPTLVEKLAKYGLIDDQMADICEVTDTTFHNWKIAHPDFFESIKDGREEFVTQVAEHSLARRAVGYEYMETQITYEKTTVIGKDGNESTFRPATVTKTRITNKHVPPDTGALCFFLKNRDPSRWQDKIDHRHELPDSPLILVHGMQPAEIESAEFEEVGENGNGNGKLLKE